MKKKPLTCTVLPLLLAACCLLASCGKGGPDTEPLPDEAAREAAGPASVSYAVRTDFSPGARKGAAGREISDTLYGIFLEDINFALDGGMYAEMVKNRSFEYGMAAGNQNRHGWVCTDPSEEAFSFTVLDGSGDGTALNENNPHYAALENGSGGTLGIFNKGFLEGLFVEKGASYLFSGYFKSEDGYGGPVYLSLRDADGYTYAHAQIDGVTGEWRKYFAALSVSKTSVLDTETRLYVEIGTGSVCADMLSLMPADTYEGTGVRKDIGEYLEALHPSFLRFPGGCVIEGRDEESIYSWKDSVGNGLAFSVNGKTAVGDQAARPQGRSVWNGTGGHPYYTTYGMGFYEFFELCEILDCLPVPVLNAGMTCQVQSPEYIVYGLDSPEFARAVQDALDLAEFCRGGEDTRWGAVRAAMGHPEPFPLRYIGIGNEQWQTEYYQHYRKFAEAFKAAAAENPDIYGGIELIVANGPSSGDRNGWNFVEDNPDGVTGLVDEHYYESPGWFLTNASRYDAYDRDAQAKVFLGEYAAKSNTWEAALAEAAYMTGLERNGDIVSMACYAPLLGNAVSNQWAPDLIWFSQSQVYGSVNYYVQRMFAKNVGKYVLSSELDTEGLSAASSLSGRAGLATWQTSAAFDNLKVVSGKTGEVLYECSFDGGKVPEADGWEVHEGDWSVREGRLVQGHTGDPFDTNTGDAAYVGNEDWTDYTLTVEAEILEGKEGFLIPVCVKNTGDSLFWNLGGWGNTVSCLQSVSGNIKSGQLPGTVKSVTLKHNRVYELQVTVSGNRVQCFVDGTKYVDYTAKEADALYETASLDGNGDIILKLVNVSDTDILVETVLDGLDETKYEKAGAVTVLRGDMPSDTNSFSEPKKVAPEEREVAVGREFEYLAPGYSVSVVRIRAK